MRFHAADLGHFKDAFFGLLFLGLWRVIHPAEHILRAALLWNSLFHLDILVKDLWHAWVGRSTVCSNVLFQKRCRGTAFLQNLRQTLRLYKVVSPEEAPVKHTLQA